MTPTTCDGAAEGGQIGRHAAATAEAIFLMLIMEDGDRRFGAEAFGVAVEIAVDHEVAQQHDLAARQVLRVSMRRMGMGKELYSKQQQFAGWDDYAAISSKSSFSASAMDFSTPTDPRFRPDSSSAK
jgi:hypothetical protein